ncbi:LysR family transcriptional regulator [uncultured Salinisphaera sp.]|uniref:LysR family transcriptional regulator n=1 Tax=uncultured Salinisphaera sp. TaxID=359372 RepID=UPI0032B23EB5|tara:strand:- start:2800 stop:3744 length:945 start_codon:yes stop_codon:yes gene_type:complete
MQRNIDLNALRTFKAVVDAGGFSGAAHQSQRAVSSISRQIAALEAALGKPLFYRHTRAVTLTEQGQRYIDWVRPWLDGLDEQTETLFGAESGPTGTLTINAPVAFGQRQVVTLLHSFQRRYPGVRAELRLTDDTIDPVRAGCDITFRVGLLADSSFIAYRLAQMRYVLAAAPGYLAAHGRPHRPADLAHHDCLIYQGEYGRQRWYYRGPQDETLTPLQLAGSLVSDDAASLRAAGKLGQGFVLFPSWLIEQELTEGTLEPVLTDYEWEVTDKPRSIHMLHAAGREPPAKIAAFIEHVLAEVGDPPAWDRPRHEQ